jgi:hypothetical protein
VGAAVFAWSGSGTSEAGGERVTSTVVTPVACSAPGAHDIVTLTVGGTERRAKLDGCGHFPGETVDVLAPADLTDGGTVMVATATPESPADVPARLAVLLLVLASLAGGLLGFVLAPWPTPLQLDLEPAP